MSIGKRASYWFFPVVFFIAFPHFAPRFYTILMGSTLIYGLFAISFNLLFGYTGLLSFGQAGFFALGAYAAAVILKAMPHSGLAMLFALLAAILLSVVIASIAGVICVRLSGWVFAMVTLAFGQVIFTIVYKWREVTGGDDGLYGIPIPSIKLLGAELNLASLHNHYYFILGIVGISILALNTLVSSPFGSTLRAIRDNPIRAQFIGLNIWAYKLAAFVIAGIFSAIAGALFSPFNGIANPELASWSFSAYPVIMSLIGGTGTFFGPFVGAVVYRFLEYFVAKYTMYWMLFFGTVIVFCVLSFRDGITPYVVRVGGALHARIKNAQTKG